MEAKNKRGPKSGISNNPKGRNATYGERIKMTIRLPKDLMNNVSKVTDNTTEFIIQAITEAYAKTKSR